MKNAAPGNDHSKLEPLYFLLLSGKSEILPDLQKPLQMQRLCMIV